MIDHVAIPATDPEAAGDFLSCWGDTARNIRIAGSTRRRAARTNHLDVAASLAARLPELGMAGHLHTSTAGTITRIEDFLRPEPRVT